MREKEGTILNQFLKDIEKQIREILPEECQIANVELEGPDIVIYSKNIAKFLEDETLIKKLAGTLKKRFIVRTDTTMLADPENAKKVIEETVPHEAGIKNVSFDTSFNEVNIEAEKLGLVIGPGGETLKTITKKTGWSPKLLRVPTTESKMMKGIRDTLVRESADRKKILKNVGKRIYRGDTKPTDWIRITGLGGWREVGRSCILLETPESKVLMDCGVSVASNENAFPYLSSVDFSLEELDAVVISHGHLDHSGFLPYLYQYGFDGPVYCTSATRDVMTLLQKDYISVLEKTAKTPPYSEKEIKSEVKHCITKEYGEVTDIAPDIRLTLHNAGHLIGSSLVHMHIGSGAHNLMYTGDLKFGYTELFDPAETRFPRLETLIIESTYGGPQDVQKPRYVGEKTLIDTIKRVTQQNGMVLIPTFAVGRAQEVMMVIEAYAKSHGGEWDIPVYLDGMTKEASAIHSAYPEYLKRSLHRRMLHNDSPFDSNIFQEVDPHQRQQIAGDGRCVMLAPAGMMNGGPVIDYFKMTADNPKNEIIFAGYQAEGSLGRKIQRGAKEVVLETNGKMQEYKINAAVQTIDGFSVTWDTPIIIRENNKIKTMPIGELVDGYIEKEGAKEISGIEAPAFDKNYKISFKPIKYVIKHKSKGKVLEIETRSGRKVKVSKGHSLFILKNEEIETVPGNKLKEGDYLAIPKQLPTNEENSITAREARALGYYAAEGHASEDRVGFSFGSHEIGLINDCQECMHSLGYKTSLRTPHDTEVQVMSYSKQLSNKIARECGKGAHNKRIPAGIFSAPNEMQLEYAKAYFDGDGYLDNHSRRKYLTAKTASNNLASDLSYLMLQNGIITRLKKDVSKARELNGNMIKECECNKVMISGGALKKFNPKQSYPPFALPLSEIKLERLLETAKGWRLRNLIKGYINNMKKGKKHIGTNALSKILEKVPDEKLEKLVRGDISFDPIICIKEIEGTEYEYDVSVPGLENFCGGFGGIMLHNSGHADLNQLLGYFKKLSPKPERVLTVHGEENKCMNLARSLSYKFRVEATSPRNLDSIRLK